MSVEMRGRMFHYNIVLIGFMGSGKSTAADYMKRRYSMNVVEMDQEIVEKEGMSIPDIFASRGEEYFRDLETQLLIDLQEQSNTVISCGGGVPLREINVAEMKKNGKVVWLQADPRTVYERVKNCKGRPLLDGKNNVEDIAALIEQRREKYENAADLAVRTDGKTVQQICEEIITRLMELDSE